MQNTASKAFFTRLLAAFICSSLAIFLVHHYLYFWWDWPELLRFSSTSLTVKLAQSAIMLGLLIYPLYRIFQTPNKTLEHSAQGYAETAILIANIAFWSVFYIGLADVIISWLRVENNLTNLIGSELASQLGRSQYRAIYIHTPCLFLALATAFIIRGSHFIWLSLLIVIAEFGIVISRFIFSYEQAFMADLVRFWYAALFLFSSGYTLLHEAHVRVDVLYENFKSRNKAISNITGIFLFGLPLCWCILYFGMQSKSASLIAPLLAYEISQSGYGMYVKYLMAGFLFIFAAIMVVQFMHLFLKSCAVLIQHKKKNPNHNKEAMA